MAAKAIFKTTLNPDRYGYDVRFPHDLRRIAKENGVRLTPVAKDFCALVWGFGNKKDEKTGEYKPQSEYKTTYEQLHDDGGISRSAAYEHIKELEEAGAIERRRNADGTTSYKFVWEIDTKKGYDVVPLFIKTLEVEVDGVWKRLPRVAQYTLAYMLDKGKLLNQRRCEASITDIVKAIHASRSAVRSAIKRLIAAGLITRGAHEKGKSSQKRSVYHVDKRLYAYKLNGNLARSDEEDRKKILKETREVFYRERQKENSTKAKQYADKYMPSRIPELKDVAKKLNGIELRLVLAELGRSGETAEQVVADQNRLEAEKALILRRYGYNARMTSSDHYIKCKECRDTGQKADGKPCDCWKVLLW